jgi:hypothetical protein
MMQQAIRFRNRMRLAGALLICAAFAVPTLASAEYSISHWTIAGGGVIESESTDGQWRLSGTIGQWEATEARALSGGQWRLTGGFWGFSLEELSDFLFRDRFEENGMTQSADNHVEVNS